MVRENIRRLRQRPSNNDPYKVNEISSAMTTSSINENRPKVCAVPFGRNYFYPLTATYRYTPQQQHPLDDDSLITNNKNDQTFANNNDNNNNIDNDILDRDESDICNSTCIPLPWNRDDNTQRPPLLPISATCSSQSTIVVSPSDGKVYQTGTMHGTVYTNWKHIIIPLPLKCVQVSAGRHFCLARLEGGNAVLSWGAGHFGQLGVVISSAKTTNPSRNRHHKEDKSCRSDEDDDDDDDDSNGTGSVRKSPSVKCISFTAKPVLIERLLPSVTGSPIQSIAAGDWHALALTESGHVWSWGSNRSLQCGIPLNKDVAGSSSPSTMGSLALPLPIPGLPPMKQIAAGRAHSCALTAGSGKVYCWGNSHAGQCGTGTTLRRSVKGLLPTPVQGLPSSLEMIQIDAAGNHCISLSKAGRVFTWGDGREGQLGFSIATSTSKCISLQDLYSNKPRLVADLDFVAVAASHVAHSDYKHSTTTERNSTPALSAAQLLARTPKITSVCTSETGSTALSSSGHVYCWGSNDVGQLGILMPTDIPHETLTDTSMPDHSTISRHANVPSHCDNHPAPTRHLHMQTFDSNHNVILPIRLIGLDEYFIRSVVMGPNHMFCFGTERSVEEKSMMVGKTLHEAHLKYEQKLGDNATQTTVNPYGRGILHKPIATGILDCSILADKGVSHLGGSANETGIKASILSTTNNASSANVNAETTDTSNIPSEATPSKAVVLSHLSSSTSSSPITTSSSNPIQEHANIKPLGSTTINSAESNATAKDETIAGTGTSNTSDKESQLWQSSNSSLTDDIKSEKRGNVGRRRFSFGLFTRRSSSSSLQQQQQRRLGRSRHRNGTVITKDDNEPSTGTV